MATESCGVFDLFLVIFFLRTAGFFGRVATSDVPIAGKEVSCGGAPEARTGAAANGGMSGGLLGLGTILS